MLVFFKDSKQKIVYSKIYCFFYIIDLFATNIQMNLKKFNQNLEQIVQRGKNFSGLNLKIFITQVYYIILSNKHTTNTQQTYLSIICILKNSYRFLK